MDNVLKKIQKLAELAVTLGTISFIFYFIGFLYITGYYFSLGVIITFLEPSYQTYVIIGIFRSLILVMFLPLFIDWYALYSLIREKKKFIEQINKQIKEMGNSLEKEREVIGDKYYNTNKNLLDTLKEEAREATQEINKIKENFSYIDPFKITNISNLIIFITYSLFTILLYLINKTAFTTTLIQGVTGLALSLLFFNYIKSIVDGSKIMRARMVCLFLFIILVLFPFVSGYIQGQSDTQHNNFKSVDILTKNGKITNMNFINFEKNFIILKKERNIIYIPESEIIKIEDN